MILQKLDKWSGSVEVDNKTYPSVSEYVNKYVQSELKVSSVILHSQIQQATESEPTQSGVSFDELLYRVTVKAYMTKKSSPDFDFMKHWNNDVPMPLRTMVGTKERETAGMVYMKLHGDITAPVTYFCMKCGKPITNPISQYFGMGPECGGHNYVNPFSTEAELKEAVEQYRKEYLQKITWEGWIIKSSITQEEKLC